MQRSVNGILPDWCSRAGVAVAIQDPENPFRYIQVRGEVIAMTTEGGAESV